MSIYTKRYFLFPLYLLTLLFNSTSLQAMTVTGLYKAEVPIDGYRSATSKNILKQGMLQVLIKATGNSAVADHPNIAEALDNPEGYLLKYTQQIKEKSEEVLDTDEVVTTKQLVSIQNYSAPRIETLLKKSDIALWGQQRPATIAWMMIEFGPQNRIILNESDMSHFNNLYKDVINRAANKRGLPITYPIQDLEEQLEISPTVIWAQFPEELQKASVKYDADVVVAASFQPKDDSSWQGKWLVIDKDHTTEFITTSPQLTTAIDHGVNWLADKLAKVYTTNLDAPLELINVKIGGINTLDKYIAVDKYLSSLSVIDHYKLNKMGQDWLNLGINVKNGESALLETLDLDSKLVRVKPKINIVNLDDKTKLDIEQEQKDNKMLQFRWRS